MKLRRAAMAMIVLVVAGIFSPMLAHEPLDGEFTCPICHKTYMDIFLAPQPFYITMGGLGQGPELRSWSYMGPGHYWAMCCPFCGYANTSTGFHLVYQDHEERRENPFEPNNCKAPQPATAPAPVREPSQTQPAGAGAASRPAPTTEPAEPSDTGNDPNEPSPWELENPGFVRLFPARPLDYLAIQANLKKCVDPSRFRLVNAYIPERLDIMLKTVPNLSEAERFRMALTAAWSCDDSGDTDLAAEFRTRAIAAGQKLLKDTPGNFSAWERISLRYRIAEMQMTVGRRQKNAQLHAAGRASMEQFQKDLSEIQKRYESRTKQLEDQIAGLVERIRQRAKTLTKDGDELIGDDGNSSSPVFKDGNSSSAVFSTSDEAIDKDPKVIKLRAEIRELRVGKEGQAQTPRDLEDLPLVLLKEDFPQDYPAGGDKQPRDQFAPIRDRVALELAIDALRDVPLEKALETARKGTVLDRQAFLCIYGDSLDQPQVREYVHDLLAPLWDGLTSFWGNTENTPESELRGLYMQALARAFGYHRADAIAVEMQIGELLMDRVESSLPNPSLAQPKEDANALWRSDVNEVYVKMVPANSDIIRKALKLVRDAPEKQQETGTDSYSTTVTKDLCRLSTPWMAEILLDDLSRRPLQHLGLYFTNWESEGNWELPEFGMSGTVWRRTIPGRMVAIHLADRASRQAREALADLERGKVSPEQAAAALIPLHYMADAESLATLRLAARRPEEALRGVAVAAMLHRGDSMAMDVILDIALRNKALPRVPKESVFLLRDEHKPKLRQLRNLPVRKDPASMPAAQEEAENHRQPVWIESYQCNSDPIWVLEALGHLGDANALREYNAYAFTVRTQIGSPRGASGDRVSKLYHTPLTARASDLESMLNLVYSSYCTEAMAKELMDGLKVLPQWFSLADVRVLEAFAANPKLHDRYRKLAADLAGRPIPLKTKQVLMHNAVRIRVLEVNDALKRWATSDYSGLARDARKTLQELVAK